MKKKETFLLEELWNVLQEDLALLSKINVVEVLNGNALDKASDWRLAYGSNICKPQMTLITLMSSFL